jgi:hypothetical protein
MDPERLSLLLQKKHGACVDLPWLSWDPTRKSQVQFTSTKAEIPMNEQRENISVD